MVVDKRLAKFDGRVAVVRSSDSREGYLLVKVEQLVWDDGTMSTGVTFRALLRHGTDDWSFSDRADPDHYDAIDELLSGLVLWYGQTLTVGGWLNEDDADHVVEKLFA